MVEYSALSATRSGFRSARRTVPYLPFFASSCRTIASYSKS